MDDMKHGETRWKDKSDPDVQKQAILLALYAFALMGRGFHGVTAHTMEIPEERFGWALYVLQMRGLIEGCVFHPQEPGDKGQTMGVDRENLTLTKKGFEQAEEILRNPEAWFGRENSQTL